MSNTMEEIVELNDVQGIIVKAYQKMEAAKYLLLHINDAQKTKSWINQIINQVASALQSSQMINNTVHIAFTCEGIKAIGISKESIATFPIEFIEGMATSHRQRVLGDFDESDPEKWFWGGPKDPKAIHVLLMLYADNETEMNSLYAKNKALWESASLDLLYQMDTIRLPEQKEHFGFRDGIGQPVMKFANRDEASHDANNINPGEFIFGYKNEYDKYTFSLNVTQKEDSKNILQADKNFPDRKDLGRNGSLLVFRQLHQDVKKFWKTMYEKSSDLASSDGSSPEHIASKMFGRWPNGSPLTKCPVTPEDKYIGYDNFGYAKNDFDGFKCPVGAHIRRSNPRDNFLRNSTNSPEKDIEKSQKFMKRFRIIRRGRPFGLPVAPSMNPIDVLNSPVTDTNRGMYFICFNSNIGRQFELISQTWINNPKFAGLYEDPDPIVGYPGIIGEGATSTFTKQATLVRTKIDGLPRFVWTKGGGYFFMPGINSLKYLASI